MSWTAEVQTDATGQWYGNNCRFPTTDEAADYVSDLASRWTLVKDVRVVQVNDDANYTFKNMNLVPILPIRRKA